MDVYSAKYEEIRYISEGGSGAVYLAKNRETGQLVAAKRLDAMYTNINKVIAEVDYLIELSSINNATGCYPHIACYYETISAGHFVYIIMEYIPGKELQTYVKDARQSKISDDVIYDTLLQVLKQLLQTLVYIHGKNIVHADIKPQNILIKDKDYIAVLIDFDLACRSNCHKSYIPLDDLSAPEIDIHNTFSPASDIWALGLSFYNAIYGNIWPPTTRSLRKRAFFKYISDPAHTPQFHTSNLLLNKICQSMLVVDWKLRPNAVTLLEMFPPTK
jgi:serine/threonine protein kinase